MTARKILVAATLFLGTVGMTTATLAQVYYEPYGYHYGYRYGFRHGAPYSAPDWMRGGPGPRVLDGIGAER